MSAPWSSNLAGWPFWASVIAHAAGIAVASAAAGTPARPSPPPVPIQLVQVARPTPPPEPPRPRVVRAPRILHQPTTAPTSTPSAPASLLDDAPPSARAPAAEPVAPDRRFMNAAAAAGPGVSSRVPAGSGALFATGDLPVAAGRGASGGQGGGGTAQSLVATGTGSGLTEFARPLGGYQTTPRYPESARRQGIEGVATLRFVVLATGRVDEVLVARSAGHVDLDRAAVDAVKTWRFEPARRGKEAVAVWVTLPVRFELHNE
jgi:periplasmic protein TonB